MWSRERVGLILACAGLSAGAGFTACAPAEPPRNLLMIVVDTLRADALGSYGNTRGTSPQIDEFAAESVVFERAWAQGTYTPASFVSFMSSTHVRSHGWDFHVAVYPRVGICGWDDLVTLAETLAGRGFATTAWVANHRLIPTLGFSRGFERWNDPRDPDIRTQPDPLPPDVYLSDRQVVHRAESALAAWREGEREFLYVHIMGPHLPLVPSAGGRAALGLDEDWIAGGGVSVKRVVELRTQPDAPERARLHDGYLAQVWDSDRAVGRILASLDAAGHRDDTVVVLLSDHGEEIWEHGDYGHGDDIWEQLARVPLMIRAPQLAPDRHGASAVALLDVAPTVLRLLGFADAPAAWQGQDLFGGTRREGVVTERLRRFAITRDGREKVTATLGRRDWSRYDLSLDPTEQGPRPAPPSHALRTLLAEWVKRTPRVRRDLRAEPVGLCAGLSDAAHDDHAERLRALGYVR